MSRKKNILSVRPRFAMVAAFAACLLFSMGCAHTPAPAPAPHVEAEAILTRIKTPQSETFKGIGRFEWIRNRVRLSGRLAYMGATPEKMRAEVLSPFGQPILSMAANGEKLFVYARSQNKYLRAAPSSGNMQKALGVRVPVEHLVTLLGGGVPTSPWRSIKTTLEPGRAYGRERVCVLLVKARFNRWLQKVVTDETGETVLAVTYYTPAKEPAYTVRLYQNKTGLPREFEIYSPKGDVLRIRPQRFFADAKVEDAQFALPKPEAKKP